MLAVIVIAAGDMTRNSRNCIELGGETLIREYYSYYYDPWTDLWEGIMRARFEAMLARKYIKIERRRIEELVKLILSMVTYIMTAYIRLIRNYRRASGWRITEEE